MTIITCNRDLHLAAEYVVTVVLFIPCDVCSYSLVIVEDETISSSLEDGKQEVKPAIEFGKKTILCTHGNPSRKVTE